MNTVLLEDLLGVWRIVKSDVPMTHDQEFSTENFRCHFSRDTFVCEHPNAAWGRRTEYKYTIKDGLLEGVSKGGSRLNLKIKKTDQPDLLEVTSSIGNRDWLQRVLEDTNDLEGHQPS